MKGVRAALAYSPEIARLSRQHNNANVLSIGGRFHEEEEAWQIVRAFLETPFSRDERHQRRIDAVGAYEA